MENSTHESSGSPRRSTGKPGRGMIPQPILTGIATSRTHARQIVELLRHAAFPETAIAIVSDDGFGVDAKPRPKVPKLTLAHYAMRLAAGDIVVAVAFPADPARETAARQVFASSGARDMMITRHGDPPAPPEGIHQTPVPGEGSSGA